jgi:hypothetical protein
VGFVADKMTLEEVVFLVAELSAANIAPVMLHTHLHPQISSLQTSKLTKPGVLPTKSGNRVQYKERTVSLQFLRHTKINAK